MIISANKHKKAEIQEGENEMDEVMDDDDVDSIQMKQWLASINMDQYFDVLLKNEIHSLEILKQIQDKSELEEVGIAKLSDCCLLMSELRKLTMKHNVNYDDFFEQVNIVLSIHFVI